MTLYCAYDMMVSFPRDVTRQISNYPKEEYYWLPYKSLTDVGIFQDDGLEHKNFDYVTKICFAEATRKDA
jgi:hypothetical protein